MIPSFPRWPGSTTLISWMKRKSKSIMWAVSRFGFHMAVILPYLKCQLIIKNTFLSLWVPCNRQVTIIPLLNPSKYHLLETHFFQLSNMIVYVSITEILKLYQLVPKTHLFSFEFVGWRYCLQWALIKSAISHLCNKWWLARPRLGQFV